MLITPAANRHVGAVNVQPACGKPPRFTAATDYCFDACYDHFTAGPADRMHHQWPYFRASGGDLVGT